LSIKLNLKIKEEFFLIIFFVAGMLFYLNIDKVPLTHPGNIKAADPFYHVVTTENLIDTRQWNYYDYYIALGQENVLNNQPPLFYTNSAILTFFSSVPAWVTLYFLVCLSQAFFIFLVYLITYEIFENKRIALIASGLTILPIPVSAWLYGLYIGFWLQVPSYFLVVAFYWLSIKYIKSHKNWILIFLGLIISGIMFVHTSDLTIILFAFVLDLLVIFFEFIKKKNIYATIKQLFFFGFLPFISLLILLPRILYVWSDIGGQHFTLGYYGFGRDIFPKAQYGGFVWPEFSFVPMIERVLFILGMILLGIVFILFILSYFSEKIGLPYLKVKASKKPSISIFLKKDKNLFQSISVGFIIISFYFAMVYLSPVIFSSPYYLGGRARALQPVFIYPVLGFIIYLLLYFAKIIVSLSYISSEDSKNSKGKNTDNKEKELAVLNKTLNVSEIFVILLIVLVIIFSHLSTYKMLSSQMSYEHIPLTKWYAYKWLQENTDKKAVVLFFDGTSQSEQIYTKRITSVLLIEDIQKLLNEYVATNVTPTKFQLGGWGGDTIRGSRIYEKSFLKYEKYSEPNTNVTLSDVDYMFFWDYNPQIAEVNHFFASEYINKYGFVLAYNQNGYIIIKNGNKNWE